MTIRKETLKSEEDWLAWMRGMHDRNAYVGHKSSREFPCVVVWCLDEPGTWPHPPEMAFEFVDRSGLEAAGADKVG